jgi:signal transduction histidine kinase
VLSPAAALAIGSAAIAAFVATTMGRLVAAPGWRDARWVPLIAWTATAFAACSAIPLLTASPRLVVAAQGWRYAFAGVHVVGWVRHSARPLGVRPATVRTLTVVLLALALAMAVPGAAYREPIDVRAVAWLGSVYRLPTPRPLSHLSAALLVSVMLGLGVLQLRAARRGAPGALGNACAALFLGAGGVHAELVVLGLGPAPDVLAPGAIIPAIVVASLTASRFVAEARELSALRVRLERRVHGRTRVLALSREALRRTEALASLGRVARRAAHEVNNPAASVIANLGWARDQLDEGGPPLEIAAALRDALDSARRVRALGQRLAELGAAPPGEARATVALDRAVADALAAARARVPEADAVPVEVDAPHEALADPPVLVRALETLLENALRAAVARPPGRVTVLAERAGGRVAVRIADRGPGMDRAVLDRLGEPFFTTRPFESHGLGVATARALAVTLEGELRFESAPGEGTRAILDLPAPPAPPRSGGAA